MSVNDLLHEIRSCRICQPSIQEPRPVLQFDPRAKILLAGQAPGARVHASGRPYTDPSGDRLRKWMNVTEDTFYDASKIAIVPMGFCFPGYDKNGADKPPPRICAKTWRSQIVAHLVDIKLILLIGGYAMRWHAPESWNGRVTDMVVAMRDNSSNMFALPHPSWRNSTWLKKHPWFEEEVVPRMQERIAEVLA